MGQNSASGMTSQRDMIGGRDVPASYATRSQAKVSSVDGDGVTATSGIGYAARLQPDSASTTAATTNLVPSLFMLVHCLRRLDPAMPSTSRYFATVRRAIATPWSLRSRDRICSSLNG